MTSWPFPSQSDGLDNSNSMGWNREQSYLNVDVCIEDVTEHLQDGFVAGRPARRQHPASL